MLVNGKKVKTTKAGGRFNANVDPRGLPKGRFTVRITVTTTGRKIVGQRRYKTCLPRQKGKSGPKL